MSDARFKQHFDMLSLHEPVTKKAKFWQSYVRALKGTEDMRADSSASRRPRPRLLSEFPSFIRSSALTDDLMPYSSEPSARIFAPGYRYLPVSRETYGYSPRNLYGYDRPSTYRPRPDVRGGSMPPMRATSVPPLDYEPFRASSLAPRGRSISPFGRGGTPLRGLSPIRERSLSPMRASSLPPGGYPFASRYPNDYFKPQIWSATDTPAPRPFIGDIYNPGGARHLPYLNLLNPSPYMPVSAVTRNPWWHAAPYNLRPVDYIPRHVLNYPSSLRNSYLSPVRHNYVWSRHPLRPL